MGNRLYWMELAAGMILGVLSWGWWQPSVMSILGGMVTLSILLMWIGYPWLQRSVLVLLVFLLGNGRVAYLENVTDSVDGSMHSVLYVQQTIGKEALLENEAERWRMRFYPAAPPQGAWVGVWHLPVKLPPVLKGGRDTWSQSIQSRRPMRQVKAWELITAPQRMEYPTQLAWTTHGGIIWALISGDKSGISQESKRLMRNTGTSHLLAISGMHIGLLAMFGYGVVHILFGWGAFMGLGVWVHRVALVVSIVVAWLYGAQVGWPASAQRAVLMITIFSFGKLWEMEISLWSVLGIAIVVMLSIQPDLVYDLGFQLSFSAVAGIGGALRVSEDFLSRQRKWAKLVFGSLVVSAGATLGTLPLCGLVFQALPLMGLLCNLFAGPLMGTLAVPTSMVAVILSQYGYVDAAGLLFCLADVCIDVTMYGLRLFETEVIVLALNATEALVLGGCLFGGVMVAGRAWKVCAVLVGCCICVNASELEQYWRSISLNKDSLQVRFLNVGQGDATLVEWGDGEVWLVDGGPVSFELVPYLRREGIWHIDQAWLSHPHADHMDGLKPVLEQLSVDQLVIPRRPNEGDNQQFAALLEVATQNGIQIKQASEMTNSIGGRGVRVLHPHDWTAGGSDRCNEESVVLEIGHYQHRVLLTGDIEEDAEAWLLDKVRDVSILKVAHHGSHSSTSPDFLSIVRPEHAIISAGMNNRFKHPHPSTLWNLRDTQVWRTDWQGTIVAKLTSASLVVSVE